MEEALNNGDFEVDSNFTDCTYFVRNRLSFGMAKSGGVPYSVANISFNFSREQSMLK